MAVLPNDDFLSVYNSTIAAKAEQEMMGRMKDRNLGSVSFLHGFIQAFFNGNFFYTPGGMPTNLTAFALTEADPYDSKMQNRPILLQMRDSMGSRMNL